MKIKLLRLGIVILLIWAVSSISALAQGGEIRESLTFNSDLLNKDVEYSIYLPAAYEATNRNYPVLYLLHGFSDDETGWTQFGQVKKIADKLADNVDVSDMIIVMPDAGVSWYINSSDGQTMYEDFFVEEFIPMIDEEYRTRGSKEFRAVAGLSMGGYGTMIMALKHPDLFSAAAPLSAGILTNKEIIDMPQENWENVFAVPFGKGLEGKDRLTDHYQQNSILQLIETGNADSLNSVSYYIDCGDDDFLIKGNMELHSRMIDKDIDHEFQVRDGGHTWEYWRTALPEVLKFVSQSFHR
ncbi:MAG: alpha/beta hydrolase family protein [Balneolaceae bacterium]|nr:alpha/beta hydrolase family protein [Balneolaceae bacterium]